MPAARVGDMCVCAGPPDVIALGSFTVQIGGMPAARMGTSRPTAEAIVIGLPTAPIGWPDAIRYNRVTLQSQSGVNRIAWNLLGRSGSMLSNSRLGAVLAVAGLAAVGTAAFPRRLRLGGAAAGAAGSASGFSCRQWSSHRRSIPPRRPTTRRRWRTIRRSARGSRRIGRAAIGFPATGADHPRLIRRVVRSRMVK